MSFRYISIIAGVILTLGGAVALAESTPRLSHSLLTQAVSTEASPTANPSRRGRWLQDLNLSSEQKQRLKTVRSQYRDQISTNDQELRQMRQELKSLLAESASADQVRAKYRQVEASRQKVSELRFESLLAMREVLTLEQRQKFAQHMQQRQDARHEQHDRENSPVSTPES